MSFIKYTKSNIRRTPFQAIAACMVMFFTFFAILVFLLLASASEVVLKYYESKPQVIAFFKDGTTSDQVGAIQDSLATDPRVTATKFVSKEDALKIYQDRNQDRPELLELVTATILPASLEVSTQTPDSLLTIAEVLKQEPVVEDVVVPQDLVENLTSATRTIRLSGIITVAFLTVFSFLMILLIIGFKIRIKREEIEIMRLIGASPSFIRAPFILEGMFYGVAGATISWVVGYIILWYISPFVQVAIAEPQLLPINPLFMLSLLGIQIVAAVIIGGVGAMSAVRRYLRI